MREKVTATNAGKQLNFNCLGRIFGNNTVDLTEEALFLNSRRGSRALLFFL